MSKKHLTILVLSNDSAKTRQYRVPFGVYRLMRNGLVVLAVILGYVCYDYAWMRVKDFDLNELRKENLAQQVELGEFSKKIEEVETQLTRLQLFDKKLRTLSKLAMPAVAGDVDKHVSMGMGGTSFEDEGLLSPEDGKRQLAGKMRADLDTLKSEADAQEKSFNELKAHLSERASILASTPSIWPVRGWVSSGYGKRQSPFTGAAQTHTGLDIANKAGTPIVAPADGTVISSGYTSGLGNTVVIRHGYGITTTYGHLSKALVNKGDRVKRGQRIAEMGNTGRSTGPHLHYDVAINGRNVDPMDYILN